MSVSRECLNFWGYPLLSRERVKLRTSNFEGTFIGKQKPMKNVGNNSCGCSQGVMRILRHYV